MINVPGPVRAKFVKFYLSFQRSFSERTMRCYVGRNKMTDNAKLPKIHTRLPALSSAFWNCRRVVYFVAYVLSVNRRLTNSATFRIRENKRETFARNETFRVTLKPFSSMVSRSIRMLFALRIIIVTTFRREKLETDNVLRKFRTKCPLHPPQ